MIQGMALDAGFRADALANGMAKHLIAMLNGSDHQVGGRTRERAHCVT
jgi:hypothetical protein